MELFGKGKREGKGYCAAQLAASSINLAYELFQSSSSFSPEEEEEEGATLCWCSHKKQCFLLCLLLSKLVTLRDRDLRWRPGFQTILPLLASYGATSLHVWGISLLSRCPSLCSLVCSCKAKDSVRFRIS